MGLQWLTTVPCRSGTTCSGLFMSILSVFIILHMDNIIHDRSQFEQGLCWTWVHSLHPTRVSYAGRECNVSAILDGFHLLCPVFHWPTRESALSENMLYLSLLLPSATRAPVSTKYSWGKGGNNFIPPYIYVILYGFQSPFTFITVNSHPHFRN